jgi:hypothetical protein
MQFYSSLYWNGKIKPVYMEEMDRLTKVAEEAGLKKPATINVANKVTKQLWDAESEEVRAEVRAFTSVTCPY